MWLNRLPEREEIEHNLRRFPMRARTEKAHEKLIDQIKKIMHPSVRRYLNIFSIHGRLNMKQSIFHAIFKGIAYPAPPSLDAHVSPSLSSLRSTRTVQDPSGSVQHLGLSGQNISESQPTRMGNQVELLRSSCRLAHRSAIHDREDRRSHSPNTRASSRRSGLCSQSCSNRRSTKTGRRSSTTSFA